MIDNDGNLTTGGVFSIMALVMGPLVLAITLGKLFFRAPLAAILGTAFCIFVVWVGVALTSAMISGMNPLAALLVVGLMLCFGAGLAYGIASTGWLQNFFAWECSVLKAALLHGGILGRAFYVLIQILPGLLLALVAVVTLFLPDPSGGASSDVGLIMGWIIMGWLLASQIMVLKFHRTDHPVGHQVTFTGALLADTDTGIGVEAE